MALPFSEAQLRGMLPGAPPNVKIEIVEELLFRKVPGVTKLILGLLADSDPRTQLWGVRIFCEMPSITDEDIPPLFRALASCSDPYYDIAWKHLGPHREANLKGWVAECSPATARLLLQIAPLDSEQRQTLALRVLSNPPPGSLHLATDVAFKNIRDRRFLRALRLYLPHATPFERATAISEIWQVKTPEAREIIRPYLHDPSGMVRRAARLGTTKFAHDQINWKTFGR